MSSERVITYEELADLVSGATTVVVAPGGSDRVRAILNAAAVPSPLYRVVENPRVEGDDVVVIPPGGADWSP